MLLSNQSTVKAVSTMLHEQRLQALTNNKPLVGNKETHAALAQELIEIRNRNLSG